MKKIIILIGMIFMVGCGNDTTKEKIYDNKEITVNFVDDNLKELVKLELKIEKEEITSFEMKKLKQFRMNKNEVKDLTGLEYAINLENLSILHEELNSLKPIKNLKKLSYFNLSYSAIKELPIELSSNLESLSIIDTKINSSKFMENMTNLKSLTLTDCNLNEIDLKKLNNLENVYLSDNNISDISSLKGKNKLEELTMQDNQVSDISPLENLEKLSYVNLSYNPVTNLKALESLKNLKELTIYKHHNVKYLIYDQVDKFLEKGIVVYYHR